MRRNQLLLVVLAVLIGGYLRFWNLGNLPAWCDEAFFGTRVTQLNTHQEFVPGFIGHMFGVETELKMRLPFAIAGTLSILAVYLVKPSRWSVYGAWFVAVFPVFVMYDRMARPYVMAGLFLILAWRWSWAAVPMLLCTPTAIVGLNWLKEWRHKWSLLAILGFAGLMFYMRTDLSRPGFFTVDMFLHSPRLWYVPILAAILFLAYYYLPWVERIRGRERWYYEIGLFIVCILSLMQSSEILQLRSGPPLHKWYSEPLIYNDWRGMPQVDLSTNFTQISEYYTGKGSVLLRRAGPELTADCTALTDVPKIDSIMRTKDTILVGVDSYANNLSRWFFPPAFLEQYGSYLFQGNVLVLRLRKTAQMGASGEWLMEIMPKSSGRKR